MHVHAPDDVAMACKSTLGVLAHPVAPPNSLAPLATRTSARGPPFGAGEAQDASSCTLLLKIVLVPAIFPLTHALMVVASTRLVAHPMRVPNEDRLHPFLLQEADDLSRRFVPLVAHLPFGACPQPGFGTLELAPAPRAFAAARLFTLQLPQALVVAALEAADAPTAHDQSLPGGRGCRCQVDLAQVNGGLRCSWGLSGRRDGHHHVQLVAFVPYQRDCPDVFGQVQAEAECLASPAHGQDEPFALACDRLGGPLHRHVLLGLIRVAQAGLGRLELAGGLDISEKLVADHLNALGVECELPPFGGLLQRVTIRPGLVLVPGLLMKLSAHVPHAGSFHLCRLQALSRGRGESLESIDAYRLHIRSWLDRRRFRQCTTHMRSSQAGKRFVCAGLESSSSLRCRFFRALPWGAVRERRSWDTPETPPGAAAPGPRRENPRLEKSSPSPIKRAALSSQSHQWDETSRAGLLRLYQQGSICVHQNLLHITIKLGILVLVTRRLLQLPVYWS